MKHTTTTQYREWSRYQWAGVEPVHAEPDEPHWNLVQWAGDNGSGGRAMAVDPASIAAVQTGFSGFGHNPGSGLRWAPGFGH